MKYISKQELSQLLSIEDLSTRPTHCIGLIVEMLRKTLENHYAITASVQRGNRIVSLDDNYYTLGYLKDEITLGSRYTKYIAEDKILRTQMSSTIPSLLKDYKRDGDKLYLCPGIVYRRDVRDKSHVGEPHQMDIWYLTEQQKNRENLLDLVSTIVGTIEVILKKKVEWRYTETTHNYTDDGIEVEIKHNEQWLEILECGLISKELLKKYSLDNYSGLALGLGLERLVMIIKSIDDIRVLYQSHPEIKKQLVNLNKYKVISNQPSTKRDMSIAIDENINEEELTELILNSLKPSESSVIESIQIISETLYKDLPYVAISRLGMIDTQKNVLLRIVLRDLAISIESDRANEIYNLIYENIHQGSVGYIIKT